MGITCEKRNCGVVVRIRNHSNGCRDQVVHEYAVEWSGNFLFASKTLSIFSSMFVEEDKSVTIPSQQQKYNFDVVLGPDASQLQVYNVSCHPLLEAFFNGYNCCLLAYGQTGSGKTFTMGISPTLRTTDAVCGILPRASQEIFQMIDTMKNEGIPVDFNLTFVEVYNEEIRDLLDETSAPSGTKNLPLKSIRVTEDPVSKAICILGITRVNVNSTEQLLNYVTQGVGLRMTASNSVNPTSSRSHAILTLSMSRGSGSLITTSKFHFVDLAGSERLKKTKSEGSRLKEGIHINTGLLALSNVINVLSSEAYQSQPLVHHVPYRDSKLTRLLQDSLGGNSRTVMIACIDASHQHASETLSTIKYAARARNIQNSATVNQNPHATLVECYQRQIDDLNHQIEKLKKKEHSLLQDFVLVDRLVKKFNYTVALEKKKQFQWRQTCQSICQKVEACFSVHTKLKKQACLDTMLPVNDVNTDFDEMLQNLHSLTSTIDLESVDEPKEILFMNASNMVTRQSEEEVALKHVGKQSLHSKTNLHDKKASLCVSPPMVRISPTSDDSCFCLPPQKDEKESDALAAYEQVMLCCAQVIGEIDNVSSNEPSLLKKRNTRDVEAITQQGNLPNEDKEIKTPQTPSLKPKCIQRQVIRFKRKKSDSAEEHAKDEKVYASLLGFSTASTQISNHQINRCSKFQKQNNDSSRNFDIETKTVQTLPDTPFIPTCSFITPSNKCHSPSCKHFPSYITRTWNSFAVCFPRLAESETLVTHIENRFHKNAAPLYNVKEGLRPIIGCAQASLNTPTLRNDEHVLISSNELSEERCCSYLNKCLPLYILFEQWYQKAYSSSPRETMTSAQLLSNLLHVAQPLLVSSCDIQILFHALMTLASNVVSSSFPKQNSFKPKTRHEIQKPSKHQVTKKKKKIFKLPRRMDLTKFQKRFRVTLVPIPILSSMNLKFSKSCLTLSIFRIQKKSRNDVRRQHWKKFTAPSVPPCLSQSEAGQLKHPEKVKTDKSKEAWHFQRDPQFLTKNFRLPHWKASQHLLSIKSPCRHHRSKKLLKESSLLYGIEKKSKKMLLFPKKQHTKLSVKKKPFTPYETVTVDGVRFLRNYMSEEITDCVEAP
ncbi:kinesin-like protein KIF21A isoform X2 [Hylaeus volcanicus]|uniref:kinesin-like protein KIF21A isoform X2 n=1 Tax=Hylaeus volcanicus TaxID=313075 RepID=UPI0023B7892F|nr:kinesin-like protein KIF21A isoform X2 [Hylaeus volcanicus]